ncbi:MAG TPA: tripartite tricarboxylate transporter permease [Candidatus Thermoplasmatota archaeon]|nr:tripartite tricarboxylate transporter permease [Candidatus Thermoplasmatota archaeon]
MTPVASLLAGIALGCAAGLVPGLHANTLVTLLLATRAAEPVLLVSMAASHAMVAILPSTYLGIPAESGHLGVLPAHRLLLQGHAREALQVAAAATLGATVLAVGLLLPFKWFWVQPGNAAQVVPRLVPFLVVAVPFGLAWRERRKGWRACLWGLTAFALSGGLGLLAPRLHAQALLPMPASALGALLSGLFGGASLLSACLGDRPLPEQDPPRRQARRTRVRIAVATAAGVLASAATALLPGATPALVASATPRTRDPRAALASLAAVGAAQPVFAVALLWLNGQARSGLALGIEAGEPVQDWASGRPPSLLLGCLAAWLAAAAAGCLVARGLDRPVSAWLPRLPQAPLSAAGLGLLLVLSILVAGPIGSLLFLAGTVVGLVPLAAGVRRVHLIGALLVPVALG